MVYSNMGIGCSCFMGEWIVVWGGEKMNDEYNFKWFLDLMIGTVVITGVIFSFIKYIGG